MPTTLLIVDDSKSSRQVNIAWVRDLCGGDAECIECIEAASGEEALAVLAQRRVDLVLLDLTMPGMSGYEVLADLRRRQVTVPVIVVSADIQKAGKERVAALGAIGFIEKPVSREALRTMLAAVGVLHD